LKILKAFGFNENIYNWIEVILNSYSLTISLNGKLHDYFHCKRGVRQGDCISHLLFCIAEEVMSRGISRLVDEGKLDLIKGSRKPYVPSHVLYIDDIMFFFFAEERLQALLLFRICVMTMVQYLVRGYMLANLLYIQVLFLMRD
jgi:hypothetical protein